jgi:hypothetical protein
VLLLLTIDYVIQNSKNRLVNTVSFGQFIPSKLNKLQCNLIYLPNKDGGGETQKVGMEGLNNEHRSYGDINCCSWNVCYCSNRKQKLSQTSVNNFFLL